MNGDNVVQEGSVPCLGVATIVGPVFLRSIRMGVPAREP